jgi:hypothetical protein
MSQFNVAITYTDGKPVVTWDPKPTSASPCQPGDSIEFSSPNQDTVIDFPEDSPFEANEGPQQYAVQQGRTITKQINPRAAGSDSKFKLPPRGPHRMGVVPVLGGGPGTGLHVPVGRGR